MANCPDACAHTRESGCQPELPISIAPAPSYSATEAAQIAGITYRQIDYWDRTAVVTASATSTAGRGGNRQYTFGDLVRLKVAARLSDAGLTLGKIRRVIRHITRAQRDGPYHQHEWYAVSDGTLVPFAAAGEQIGDVMDYLGRAGCLFVFSVEAIRTELALEVSWPPAA